MRLIAAALITLSYVFPAAAFDTIGEVNAYIEKHRGDKMPDGYQLPLTFCIDGGDQCHLSQALMLKDMRAAYRKGYQAQRNVTYCLWSGCDGSVQQNKNLGCAWNVVILASGSPKIIDLDVTSLEKCLREQGPVNLGVIKSQAAALFQTIYKRQIPADWQ